ncbi:Glutamyl-tRNA(Gln) amidotransferase subunit A, chloroplastic/mitochondrial [Streptomyces glaucescens]
MRLPLLGVPVAVKDDMDVAGEPTAFGCQGPFPPAAEDSEAVRRLRAAGAVIVGKTNTCELGQWPFTEGPAFGATRNPWHTEHTPGGSSGGSAAAVAAGLVPAALGSDGAGSVRIPAAWTHLVGIKPQRGRISTWPRGESFQGITVNGPLARTVADAALLLDAASGNHARDPHQPPALQISEQQAATRPAAHRTLPQAAVHRAARPARPGDPCPGHRTGGEAERVGPCGRGGGPAVRADRADLRPGPPRASPSGRARRPIRPCSTRAPGVQPGWGGCSAGLR